MSRYGEVPPSKIEYLNEVLHGVHGAMVRKLVRPVLLLKKALIRRRLVQRQRLEQGNLPQDSRQILNLFEASIQHSAVLSLVPPAALPSLVNELTMRSYTQGEVIIFKDEPALEVLFVARGMVLLTQNYSLATHSVEPAPGHLADKTSASPPSSVASRSVRYGRSSRVALGSTTSGATTNCPRSVRTEIRKAPFIFGEEHAAGGSPHARCLAASLGGVDCFVISATRFRQLVSQNTTPLLLGLVKQLRRQTLATQFAPTISSLQQSWLFRALPDPIVSALLGELRPHTYEPGEVMVQRDSTDRTWHMLRRGKAMAEFGHSGARSGSAPKEGASVVVDEGSTFGEISLVFGGRRSATVVATTACDTWVLPYAAFAPYLANDDSVRALLQVHAAALRAHWLDRQRWTADNPLRQALQHSALLAGASPETIDALVGAAVARVYPQRTLLASPSDICNRLIVIVRGKAMPVRCDVGAAFDAVCVLGEECLASCRWSLAIASSSILDCWEVPREQLLNVLRQGGAPCVERARAYSEKILAENAFHYNNGRVCVSPRRSTTPSPTRHPRPPSPRQPSVTHGAQPLPTGASCRFISCSALRELQPHLSKREKKDGPSRPTPPPPHAAVAHSPTRTGGSPKQEGKVVLYDDVADVDPDFSIGPVSFHKHRKALAALPTGRFHGRDVKLIQDIYPAFAGAVSPNAKKRPSVQPAIIGSSPSTLKQYLLVCANEKMQRRSSIRRSIVKRPQPTCYTVTAAGLTQANVRARKVNSVEDPNDKEGRDSPTAEAQGAAECTNVHPAIRLLKALERRICCEAAPVLPAGSTNPSSKLASTRRSMMLEDMDEAAMARSSIRLSHTPLQQCVYAGLWRSCPTLTFLLWCGNGGELLPMPTMDELGSSQAAAASTPSSNAEKQMENLFPALCVTAPRAVSKKTVAVSADGTVRHRTLQKDMVFPSRAESQSFIAQLEEGADLTKMLLAEAEGGYAEEAGPDGLGPDYFERSWQCTMEHGSTYND